MREGDTWLPDSEEYPHVRPDLLFVKDLEIGETTTEVPRPEVGAWDTFLIVNEFEDPGKSDPYGSPGDYQVVLALGHPSIHVANVNVSPQFEGDSFLQAPEPTAVGELQARGPDGKSATGSITTNKDGRLAKLTFAQIAAQDRFEAEAIAYDLAKGYLAWLSFVYDKPVDIAQIVSTELSTGSTGITQWMSPKIIAADNPLALPMPLDEFLVECLTQYQEGNNTTNDFYRFLCFWKVLDGVQNIRSIINKEAERARIDLSRSQVRVPEDDTFPVGVRNKTLEDVRQLYRDTYRHALAHLEFTTGRRGVTRQLVEWQRVREVIPTVRFLARVSLHKEIAAYVKLCQVTGQTVSLRAAADKTPQKPRRRRR